MWTTADLHRLRPHTSPAAVAYRATPEATARWAAESTAAYQTQRDEQTLILDRWRPLFAEAIDPQFVHLAYRHQWHGEPAHRGHDHHFSPSGIYPPPALPYCRPLTSRGTRQAPDLRTRIGQAMQEDLDWLDERRPWTGLDQALDLPAETGPEALPHHGPAGQLLGRDSLIRRGCHYLVFEAPPAREPDPQVWTPVPVAEYRAVHEETIPAPTV